MSGQQFYRTFAQRSTLEPTSLSKAPLAEWLESPGLTFVIGPGCARVGNTAHDVLQSVARSMARCFAKIGRAEGSIAQDALDRTYLATLAATKGVDMTMADDSYSRVDPSDPDAALDEVRIVMTRVARLATELLAKALERSRAPILDWDYLKIPTLGLARESTALQEQIERLVKALGDVKLIINREDNGEVVATPSPSGIEWGDLEILFGIDNICQALTALNARLKAHKPFGGAEVEWLSSLLWHSFRYAATWYPSSHEMAFQLSVGLEQGVVEVPDRPLATQTRTAIATDEGLKRLLALAARGNALEGFAGRRELYGSLARLLLQGHVTRWTAQVVPGDEPNPFGAPVQTSGPETDDHRRQTDVVAPPLALVSSFDNLLDDALEAELALAEPAICRYTTYHLILPVLLKEPGPDEASIGWVLGRREPSAAAVDGRPHWRWEVLGPRVEVNPLSGDAKPLQLDLHGPVIIKMNGDPTYEFDLADVTGLQAGTDIQPLAVLSEFQHLSVALAEIELLTRLEETDLSKGRRRLVLLGESLDDWSIRQRLFGHATWPLRQHPVRSTMALAEPGAGYDAASASQSSPGVAEAMAINRDNHPLLHSILSWVRIQPVVGELENVTPVISARVERQRALLAEAGRAASIGATT